THPTRDGRSQRMPLALLKIGPSTSRHLGVPRLHGLETRATRRGHEACAPCDECVFAVDSARVYLRGVPACALPGETTHSWTRRRIPMPLPEGKKGLILNIANDRSIA